MESKIFKIGFSVFAVFALVFGAISILNSIKITNSIAPQEKETYSEALSLAKSKVTDIDGDGLSDWEEINWHKTSPYLSDTDSDGISDYDELVKGTDPNCPEGQACGSEILNSQQGFDSQESSDEEDISTALSLGADFSEESLAAMAAMEKGEVPTASQIRSLLIDSGVPQDQVASADDKDLVDLFLEVSKEYSQ